MAEIRSALEIALSRTQDVKSDKEGLKAREQNELGKKLITAFLTGEKTAAELKSDLEKSSPEENKNISRGVFETLRSNLVLPQGPVNPDLMSRLEEGFTLITGEAEEIKFIFQQLDKFFQQYLQSREQLKEAVKTQMLPKLQAKARELGVPMGEEAAINPEAFPEFGKIFSENLVRVNEQFQAPFEEMKEHLSKMMEQETN